MDGRVRIALGLALIGIEPAYREGDPLVGFSSQLPHFVPSRDKSGHRIMMTAPGKDALNSQSFPKDKPVGTFRIVCLGGERVAVFFAQRGFDVKRAN